MKTNIILSSKDRELFGITIRQETKTQFLNLSDLQETYTQARVKNGWCDKRISDILHSKDNAERIFYLLKKGKYINTEFSAFMENVEKIGLLKYLKELKVYKTTGARNTKATWCCPEIFVLIGMELSPMLYAEIVYWITDKLILNRIEAGNFYKDLTRAINIFDNVDYIKLAKSLNYKVFGRHETGIRNLATQNQLKQLYDIENKIAYAIDMGFINSFNEVIENINKFNLK